MLKAIESVFPTANLPKLLAAVFSKELHFLLFPLLIHVSKRPTGARKGWARVMAQGDSPEPELRATKWAKAEVESGGLRVGPRTGEGHR